MPSSTCAEWQQSTTSTFHSTDWHTNPYTPITPHQTSHKRNCPVQEEKPRRMHLKICSACRNFCKHCRFFYKACRKCSLAHHSSRFSPKKIRISGTLYNKLPAHAFYKCPTSYQPVMPMNDSTPISTSPREETLLFLRNFARAYRPQEDKQQADALAMAFFSRHKQASC